jgi:DNA adenine methylase
MKRYKEFGLNRLGSKQSLLNTLFEYFPRDFDCFVDAFCGSGAVGLNIANENRAKYVVMADYDYQLVNAFEMICMEQHNLSRLLNMLPYARGVWERITRDEYDFKKIQVEQFHYVPIDIFEQIWKAAKFLILTSYGYMGKPESMKFGMFNAKSSLLNIIEATAALIAKKNIQILNCGYDKVFDLFSVMADETRKVMLYCDPPYFDTTNNYAENSKRLKWTIEDSEAVFKWALTTPAKYVAISEFDKPEIKAIAEKYGYYAYVIGERRNQKNVATEMLYTNYKVKRAVQTKMFTT